MAPLFSMQPRKRFSRILLVLLVVLAVPFTPEFVIGLEPDEILVVANRKVVEGIELSKYYMKKRKVPKKNLILVDTPVKEVCSRENYEQEIVVPIRKRLRNHRYKKSIRCLLLMYGMPLKVAAPENKIREKYLYVRQQINEMNKALEENEKREIPEPDTRENRNLLKQKSIFTDQRASVDAELSVVKALDAPIAGWIENPYYTIFGNRFFIVPKEEILLVSRLDGPDAVTVKGLIDDALYAEENGLSGNACFDARWPMLASMENSAYVRFDRSLHRAAKQFEKLGRNPVVVNNTNSLFQYGQCPDAVIYCGWYSLATYVDAFEWQRGAVGYHIASYECSTLKKANSQVWCKRMIEEGVCATIGPVNEPYVNAFPLPDVFFGLLTQGTMTLVECYMNSLPYLSWKMVLVGDPLYRPFTQ